MTTQSPDVHSGDGGSARVRGSGESTASMAGPNGTFSPPASAAALAFSLAVVGGVTALCLIAMYAFELDSSAQKVFGPLSDIGSVVWNVLLLPVVIGFGRSVLPRRWGRLIVTITAASTVVSAVSSALLVIGVLSFEESTTLTVAAIFLQAGWLLAVGAGMRPVPGWSVLGRTAEMIGVGFWIGSLLFAVSLLLGWGTMLQWIVMGIALVPGLLSWFGWPVWFYMLGRRITPTPARTSTSAR